MSNFHTRRKRVKHTLFQKRSQNAFTLVELLTVMVIIAILASIALANMLSGQVKAKNASVAGNMHMGQLAAESYGTDNSGRFPAAGSDLLPYYPNGSNVTGGSAGTLPQNPYSGALNEPLFKVSINDTAGILSTRAALPTASPGTAGQVGYNRCNEPDGTSYCITGADFNSKRIGSGGGTLVLSNF
jgi:prepilin-type N-terminal cleavage/methylation domain-containing protein